jgi:hypothetical protein
LADDPGLGGRDGEGVIVAANMEEVVEFNLERLSKTSRREGA